MRRVTAVLAVCVAMLLGSGPADAQFGAPFSGWTLSASASDPFVNFIPATLDTVTVYLWLWCANPAGFSVEGVETAYFDLFQLGRVSHVQISQGASDADPSPDVFDLTFEGCPQGSFVVAQFKYASDGFDEYIICPPFGGNAVACGETQSTLLAWIGFTVGSQVVCTSDAWFFEDTNCTPPTSVDTASWAKVKARYLER